MSPTSKFVVLLCLLCANEVKTNEEGGSTTEELQYNTTEEAPISVFSSKDNFGISFFFAILLQQNHHNYFFSVPGPPRNVTVIDVTSTTIKISWLEPNKTNEGSIHGYRIYSIHNSQTLNHIPLFKPDPDVGIGPYYYTLMNLKPFTEYKIYVNAVTKLNDGDPSEMIVQRTDVSGPSPPMILNLTCAGDNSLYLRWRRPETFYNAIDYYIISYRNLATSNFQDIKIDNDSNSHVEIGVSSVLSFHKLFF